MVTALRTVSPYASVPLIAKPNILPEHACAPEQFADWVRLLLNAGASIVGGCCGTAPEHIRAVHECLRQYKPHPMAPLTSAQENDIWLTNEKTLFALDEDRIEFTTPIACSHDMSDDFFAAERDSFDVMLVSVETPGRRAGLRAERPVRRTAGLFSVGGSRGAVPRAVFVQRTGDGGFKQHD